MEKKCLSYENTNTKNGKMIWTVYEKSIHCIKDPSYIIRDHHKLSNYFPFGQTSNMSYGINFVCAVLITSISSFNELNFVCEP